MEHAFDEERFVEKLPEIEKLFSEVRKDFRGKAEELIPMLQSVQRVLGYLPEQALLQIAALTGLSAAKVFATATFYSQFRLQPVGKHMVKVCRGTACHVKGSDRILDCLQDHLQVLPGQTTRDDLFTIETDACFGSCALAPIMVVNDSVYGNLNRSRALKLLDEIRSKD